MQKINIGTDSTAGTEKLGAHLARVLSASLPDQPCFIALYGDLGAGKTAFVRGFVSVLSPTSRVKSPTYTIVNEYRRGAYPVFHFDLYRLEDSDGLDSIGFDEYVKSGVCIAEWSEHLGEALPSDCISVTIIKTGESTREITLLLPDTVYYDNCQNAEKGDGFADPRI